MYDGLALLVGGVWRSSAKESFANVHYRRAFLLLRRESNLSWTRVVRRDGYKPPPRDWKALIRAVSKFHSLQELGDYWRLIWELSAACPVPYVSAQALPPKLIVRDQKRLLGDNFSVMVDGISLFKPVYLYGNPGGYTAIPIEPQTMKVYDRSLSFHGYIVVQEGTSLTPDELRGILIRIKNVAIGYYDPSMLDYRFNEDPRNRWLTGELYINSGLKDALNIDRDSFNRFHPQFRAVQEYVHLLLQNDVFPKVYKQIDVRSKQKAAVKSAQRTEYLADVVSKATGKSVEIKRSMRQSASSQVSVVEKAKNLQVTIPALESINTKRGNRQLAAAVLTLFELAQLEKEPIKRREAFTTCLLDLLGRW